MLALNSGSSSLKFGLYRLSRGSVERLLSGEVEGLGTPSASFHAEGARGETLRREATPLCSQQQAIEQVAQFLAQSPTPAPQAIGHRVVHGGPALRQHRRIDDATLLELAAAAAFAPLHVHPALSVIRSALARYPGLPQVACFDTTFHAQMPDVARVLPLPAALRAQGIQRYGFHGLSCESIVRQLAGDLPPRLIVAHLGSGASVTAVKDGVSVDTSMGFTPSGGLIMGTRSGDLDPGVLIYLARKKQFDAEALEDLIDHRSGLLGISGLSSDLRVLHAAAESAGGTNADANADASLAVQMFGYAARKQVAAMSAVLGGIDMLVFTGGIGENDAQVRADVCSGLAVVGISLDDARNRAGQETISDAASRCEVRVLPSLENEQIALHVHALV